MVTVTARIVMSDNSEADSYGDTRFETRAGGLHPSGQILSPRSGGPESAGSTILMRYATDGPVDADLTLYVSSTPRVSHSDGTLVEITVR